jgi:hypothetical protein
MMSIGTMGSAPPSAAPSELSILRALARLLDPEADEAIAAVAAAQPRDDVRRAVEGMAQLFDLIRSMTPIEAAVAAAIADLQHRESVLAERAVSLLKREERAARVDQALNDLAATL